jgi:hypothetical protein
MNDFREMARDPKHRRGFEKLLLLAAQRGDADLVAERLSWGIDPNCSTPKGRTPLILNARGFCPSAETVRALLKHGAEVKLADEAGLTALDYARRKLARIQAKPRRSPRKSPSLDENNHLQLAAGEQEELDRIRREQPDLDPEFFRIWWQERLRAARRVFNDPEQIEKIVELLEPAREEGSGSN